MEPWKEELYPLSQTQMGKRNNWSRNTMGVAVVTAWGYSNVPHVSPQSPLPQHILSLLGHRTSTLAKQSQQGGTGTLRTFEGDLECLENVCQTSSPQEEGRERPRGERPRSLGCCDSPLVGINQLAPVGTLFQKLSLRFPTKRSGSGATYCEDLFWLTVVAGGITTPPGSLTLCVGEL